MTVPLIGPDGKQYDLPDESKLQDAIAAGYRVEGAEGRTWGEAIKGAANTAREGLVTGAEGVLRGATAGLSDAALTKAYAAPENAPPEEKARADFNRTEISRRKEEHPWIAGAGDLAGMVASPISKIAPVEGVTALGRIGAGAVNYGIQGSLYGAGNTISESALGNTDLTAEKLVAGAGLGALLGAGAGGLGGAIEEGVKAAVPAALNAAGNALGSDALKDFANSRWLKASGGIQSDIKKIPEAEHEGVANVLRDHLGGNGVVPKDLGEAAASLNNERDKVAEQVLKQAGLFDTPGVLKSGMDKEEAIDAIGRMMDLNGKRIGAVLGAADKGGAKASYGGFMQRLADFEKGLNPAEADIIGGEVEKLRGYLDKMAAKGDGFKALNDIKSTLQSNTNWAADGPAKFGLKRQLVGILRDEIDTQLAPQVGSDLAKIFVDSKAEYGALANAEKALGKKTATGADAIRAIAEKIDTPEAQRLVALDHAANLLRHGQDRELGNRWLSLSDYMAGVGVGAARLAGGDVLGGLKGLGAAVGHKFIREKGAGAIASLADKIAASPALKVTAASFAQNAQKALPHFGQYAAPLAQAIGQSPELGLATHLVYAQAHPDYADKAQQAGFLPETPEESGFASAKANGLVGVAAALKSTDDAIERGIDKVFKGTAGVRRPETTNKQDFGAKRMRIEGVEAHQRRMDEITQMAADPNALIERVTKNIGSMSDAAPGAAAAAANVAHRAVTYLASQIQKPQKPGPLAQDWHWNDTELFKFSKKLEAVQEPLSILEHGAAGTLTKDQVEAVKAVYPTVWAQMRDKALERLSAGPKGVPYKARLMLNTLTGIDPDGTFGQAVSKNQAALSAATEKPSEQMGGSDKKSPLTVAQDTATPNQRREMDKQA